MGNNKKRRPGINNKQYADNWRDMIMRSAEKFVATKNRSYLKQMVFCQIRYLLIVGNTRQTKSERESAILFCQDWDAIVEGVSLLTPKEFVEMFPIAKRYSDDFNNNYSKTIKNIEAMFNWDEPIYYRKGKNVPHKVAGSTFLSIYGNDYISLLFSGMMINLGYLKTYYSDLDKVDFSKLSSKQKTKIPTYLRRIK